MSADKLSLTIDGQAIEVDKGTTILKAAESLGIDIPTFCYHPGLTAPANCRMCLVNTNKSPKLLPACYATCMDGMEVETADERTRATRKATLEFILLHHPVDCPICDQAGECVLQDNYFAHSAAPSRLFTMKGTKAKATPLGPNVILDAERCIVCTRCVRFCDEITGTGELRVVHRGERAFVTTFPGVALDNDYATNTVDICPVGALTSRDFRFKMRVWFLKGAESVCGGCSRGCNIHLEHGDGEVQRYRPRENADVNGWWMCDPGRLSYKALQADRITSARLDGAEHPVRQALGRAGRDLAAWSRENGGESMAIVPSLSMTDEAAQALAALSAKLGCGVWYEGGRADGEADDILQLADKNPNRAGVRAAADGAGIQLESLGGLSGAIAAGKVTAAIWFGHDHAADDLDLSGLDLRIVAASNESQWTREAPIVLPTCTFEEIDGHWTNFEGRVQRIQAGPAATGQSLPCTAIIERLADGVADTARAAPAAAQVPSP